VEDDEQDYWITVWRCIRAPKQSQHFQGGDTVGIYLRIRQLSYEAAMKRAESYSKVFKDLPQMRSDTVQLVRQAVGMGRRAYVLANNRTEGNAPLTVQGLMGMLREGAAAPQ